MSNAINVSDDGVMFCHKLSFDTNQLIVELCLRLLMVLSKIVECFADVCFFFLDEEFQSLLFVVKGGELFADIFVEFRSLSVPVFR